MRVLERGNRRVVVSEAERDVATRAARRGPAVAVRLRVEELVLHAGDKLV